MLQVVRDEVKSQRSFEQAIREFGLIVAQESTVQARLSDAIDSGMTLDEWVAFYTRLAGERGHVFTPEQLLVAMQEQRQGRDRIFPSIVQKWIAVL